MNTPSETKSGSSSDLEPDPYRELNHYVGWDYSELTDVQRGTENSDKTSPADYFAGRKIKMDAASPEPFPKPRTFPTDWDLSLAETNQAAGEVEDDQGGFSIDWMQISLNADSVKPVDLDAAK
ncbi:MAG: hypothetical protein P4L50_16290 [Anaerolineaceae bacterium]|nr:hypothetical protein [Anaerolineaceae bacterium]